MNTSLQNFLEQKAFGVCERLGEIWGIRSSRIRLYFIYVSFFTFGSPVVIYFALLFWLEHKNLLRSRKPNVWDI